MAATEKTISALVKSQLPDFIKADHPKFQRFVELYYTWLENNNPNGISNTAGNTVYHAMNIENYRDIDQSPEEFIRYFKQEILPYFPENTPLPTEKILKAAREFYSKKGSADSAKWLFKVLFGEDIEINYPKEQILIASDGKWIKPKAFRITITDDNKSVNVQLLKKKLVTGLDSGATCVVEAADRTIDPTTGIEILEIYISNIRRYFNNGEIVEIKYVDEYGVDQVFRDRIIGSISNIRIDSNIKTDPTQRRRGLYYNVGDPIVITGGLGYTLEANDAVAVVGNVTPGSIEAVNMLFPGYGYRTYYDTETIVLATYPGDYPGANANTDLRVSILNTSACTSNSQRNFMEPITYDQTVIDFLGDTDIGNSNLAFFTVNNHNAIVNVTEIDKDDGYNNLEQVWANGTNFIDAQFTAKIATPNNTLFGLGGPSANTGGLLIYDVQLKSGLTITQALSGQSIYTKNTAKVFTVNSITTDYVPANADSQLIQCFNFATVNTGGIALISVLDGGYGFRQEPTLKIDSHYDTIISSEYDFNYNKTLKKAYWQTFKDLGQIAHVYINAGGSGYSVDDTIWFSGRGYGGAAHVQSVNGTGAITSVVLDDRGEGYLMRPNITISSNGTGAVLTGYLFGDGAAEKVYTSAIGRIKDIKLIYRGYDYVSTPNVILKVMDAVVNPIPDANTIFETEYIFQGANFEQATFKANIKSLSRSTNLLRLYNQSGYLNPTLDLITANGVYMNLNTSANVSAPAQYPPQVQATGLPNPMVYGNGAAKANALFANGLIEFNGFYLNTDGFLSADKVLEDGKVYHNFSYIVQSERSLADFETPIKNIVHPIGLSLIAKTITKSEEKQELDISSKVNLIMPGNVHSTVNVPNIFGSTILGTNTLFLPDVSDINYSNTKVNVGDLFIINDGYRAPISRVVANVVSNTEIQVDGDFIYRGDGKLQSNIYYYILSGDVEVISGQNAIIGTSTSFDSSLAVNDIINVNNESRRVTSVVNGQYVTVNTNFTNSNTSSKLYKIANNRFFLYQNSLLVSNVAVPGDKISLNLATANIFTAQTGTVNISTGNNVILGTGTNFTSLNVYDTVIVNNQTRQVVNIANDTVVTVDSPFVANSNNDLLLLRATSQTYNVVNVISTFIDIDQPIEANLTNIVYLVRPELANQQFSYKVVTLNID